MALNALTGRDDSLFGTDAGSAQAMRLYPQWMRDPRQRGIGLAADYTATRPDLILIPRGDLTSGNAMQGNMMPGAQAVNYVNDPQTAGGEGGSNAENSPAAGPSQPLPGWLADFLTAATFGLFSGGGAGAGAGTTAQMPGDVTGTPFAGQVAEIASQMGPTAGTAPLGDVTAEPLGDYGAPGPSAETAPGGDMGAPGGQDTGASNGMYRGGIVTRNKLTGPDPAGPDDGYAPLNQGEGVLTAKAIKHYGPGIVARLNKLQVPKEAFGKR